MPNIAIVFKGEISRIAQKELRGEMSAVKKASTTHRSEIAALKRRVQTATFAKDCCDREILAWRAWPGKGLPGEPVREML